MLRVSPQQPDRDRSVELLKQASAGGDLEATVLLYEQLAASGQFDTAISNGLRAAAERGHPRACRLLGQAYLGGLGRPKDAALGEFWMARAAAMNEPVALQQVLQSRPAM
jgi:TPR repeat protein